MSEKVEYKRRLKKRLIRRQYGACPLCGRSLVVDAATLDHIIPRTLGGPKSVWNLRAVHGECNNERGCKREPGVNVVASLFERRIVLDRVGHADRLRATLRFPANPTGHKIDQ